MADNILTTDRAAGNLDIAAKDIAGVQFPRNILVTPAGTDITPAQAEQLPAALGQAAESASLPVVLPAVQISALTPPSAITGYATEVTLSALSAKLPASLGAKTGANSASVVPASDAVFAVSGAFWQATQPVSIAASVGVTGPLTDTQLRASAVPVSLASVPTHAVTQSGAWEVTANAGSGTFAVSAVSLPLPSGAATQATLAALLAALGPPTAVTIVSLTTSATGATFTAFGSQACEQLDLVNTAPAAVDLEIRRGASGNTIVVPGGSSRMFVGLANASDLQVRRLDQSNAQITFTAEAIKQ